MASYRPPFNIRSKDDILKVLKSTADLVGIDILPMRESFPKIDAVVAELHRSGDILVIRSRDEAAKTIFRNSLRLDRPVSDEFKRLWHDTPVPADDVELHSAMEKSGLKIAGLRLSPSLSSPSLSISTAASGGDASSISGGATRKKTVKRPFRRIKITNDYLEGIDLSIDPDLEK